MKYLVHFRLKPDLKNKAVEFFEARGPNRHLGVSFLGAWIGKEEDVAFVLLDSDSEDHLAATGKTWGQFGTYEATPVVDIQHY